MFSPITALFYEGIPTAQITSLRPTDTNLSYEGEKVRYMFWFFFSHHEIFISIFFLGGGQWAWSPLRSYSYFTMYLIWPRIYVHIICSNSVLKRRKLLSNNVYNTTIWKDTMLDHSSIFFNTNLFFSKQNYFLSNFKLYSCSLNRHKYTMNFSLLERYT